MAETSQFKKEQEEVRRANKAMGIVELPRLPDEDDLDPFANTLDQAAEPEEGMEWIHDPDEIPEAEPESLDEDTAEAIEDVFFNAALSPEPTYQPGHDAETKLVRPERAQASHQEPVRVTLGDLSNLDAQMRALDKSENSENSEQYKKAA